MDAFVHDPIDLSQPAIRLARLFGGYYTDPIRCAIFEATLDLNEIIPYKALSYVWGDEFDKREIYINEKKAFVTRNLFNALWSLRQKDMDTILWADAMCIDQSNNKEKGHQVSQMRLVYERAEETIIWLGESDDDIDILFDCAWKLDKAVGELRTHRSTQEVWKKVWEGKENVRPRFHGRIFGTPYSRRSALRRLLGRPWFKRVWVIQEAASAKRAMVRCGLKAVPTRTFAMIPHLMRVKVDSRVRAVLDVMPGPSRSTTPWWNGSRDLETLLKKFGSSESSNPRDTIYALLGISSNFKDNRVLSPDYNITFEEAVQNTIWALLFGEVLDRSLWKLPTWDKTQFLNCLQDLPGSVFDWALSERETSILVRLLTSSSVPDGAQVSSSIKGSLHRGVWFHTLIQNDGPLSAIQSFMPHADLEINRISDIHGGNSPLHLAVERGLESVVSVLLQHPKIDVNLRGNGGIVNRWLRANTPYSNFSIAGPGREVHAPDTPLNIAVANGHLSMVKLLLQYSNNGIRNQVKNVGGTALHAASAKLKGHPESAKVVELLLQHGDMGVNDSNWKEMSPLNIAVIQRNDCMTKLLLQHEEIDVNHVGGGFTPLESAVEAGSTSIVSILVKDDRIDHGEVVRLIKRLVASIREQLLVDRFPAMPKLLDDRLTILKELLAGCSDEYGEALDQTLVRALKRKELPLMQLLLDNYARTNGNDRRWFLHGLNDYQQNMTTLCAAVNMKNEAVVRLLLNHVVQPDEVEKIFSGGVFHVSEKMGMPLALAVGQGRLFIVEMLLFYGASVDHKDLHGKTPLLALLHQDHCFDRWRNISGGRWKSLRTTKFAWDTHAIELLSLHAVNISSAAYHHEYDGRHRYSRTKASISLINASKWMFGEYAELGEHQIEDWIEIGVEHEPEPCSNSIDIAQRLLAHGADIEARDNRGMTLLWMVVSRGHLQLVDLLLSFGADTEASDLIHGRTPLWVAALLDFDDMIHKLLRKGAKREVRCKHGKTPLCIAAEKGCRKAVKALVDSQADLHAEDSQGRTPLDLVRENGHGDFEGLLLPAT